MDRAVLGMPKRTIQFGGDHQYYEFPLFLADVMAEQQAKLSPHHAALVRAIIR
jgi:hypothetical protein